MIEIEQKDRLLIEKKDTYHLCVNRPEIADKLKGYGYSNLIIWTPAGIDVNTIETVKKENAGIFFIWYGDWRITKEAAETIRQNGIWTGYIKNWELGLSGNETFNEYLAALDENTKEIYGSIDYWLYIRCEDYEGRCGNCHNKLVKKHRYCSWCGTRRGEGRFLPYANEYACAYGSPLLFKYICPSCGLKWAFISINDSRKYCINCGSEGKRLSAKVHDEKELWNMYQRDGHDDLWFWKGDQP